MNSERSGEETLLKNLAFDERGQNLFIAQRGRNTLSHYQFRENVPQWISDLSLVVDFPRYFSWSEENQSLVIGGQRDGQVQVLERTEVGWKSRHFMAGPRVMWCGTL